MELLLSNFNNLGNALGWTLIHFLWQGLLLFVSYWIVTRLFLKNKITQQYWVGMFFIVMCLVIPIREFITQLNLSSANDVVIQLINNNISAAYTTGIISPMDLSLMLLQKTLPYLVVFWMAVVLLISSHLFQSWLTLLKLSKDTSVKLPNNLMQKLEEVTFTLKLKVKPIISISEKIDIPATFGFFKPVILLPLSLISKLPSEQMEAILIHELCHIKRADFLHNILQLLVETLFFYHPLTKWISRDIRKIREQCCDEMVLDLEANPMVYANALTNIASIYNKHNKLNHRDRSNIQIAVSDGELLTRIKFLMLEKRSKSPITNILLGLLFVTLALVLFNNIIAKSSTYESQMSLSNSSSTSTNSNVEVRPIYETPNIYGLFNNQKKLNESPLIKPIKTEVSIIGPSVNKALIVIKEPSIIEILSIQAESNAIADTEIQELVELVETKINTPIQESSSTNPLKEYSEKSSPLIIKKVNPTYTRLARSRGIEGTVILSFTIDKKGKVKNVNVDKSSPLKLLDGSARSALRKWRFDPKSINVRNINNRYQQIFSFTLNKNKSCIDGFLGTRLAPDQICQDL